MLDSAHSACDEPYEAGQDNVWTRAIALLKPQRCDLAYTAEDHALRHHAPIVNIIERPRHAMAVVSWRDATHCRYGDQVWTATTAREAGVCALSGKPIVRTDAVYRPQHSRRLALNAEAMILASALEAVCELAEPVRDGEKPPTVGYRSNTR